MDKSVLKNSIRKKNRAQRVRRKLRGSSEKPRLSVFRSNNHLSVQLIDDEKGVTLGHASTLSKESKGGRNKESAATVGQKIAEVALTKNIKKIVFDRGPFKYHGIIKILADKARECGLEF